MKDIVVHLDGSAEDESRLSFAELIGGVFGSHVTGLLATVLPDVAMLAAPEAAGAAAALFADLEAAAKERATALAPHLSARLGRLPGPTDLVRFEALYQDIVKRSLTTLRCADLFIATTPYRSGEAALWDPLIEAVLFGSGRATLLVPPTKKAPDVIRGILIAWRDTRDAARAVAEAMPFIERSTKVDVVLVDGGDDAQAADLASHLDRHGAKVVVHNVVSEGRTVAECILTEARHASSDLVVMGGYGHSRFREWVLGGATLDVLGASTVPLLVAH